MAGVAACAKFRTCCPFCCSLALNRPLHVRWRSRPQSCSTGTATPTSTAGGPGEPLNAETAAGYVQQAGDCNDDDDDDDDCDGAPDAIDLDVDADGLTPCAGDCDDADPLRPYSREICDGIDNDCDGFTDDVDPDRDRWSCGECELIEAFPGTATYGSATLNPCLLDPPAVTHCSEDPLLPDTHTEGKRLHRVLWRTDIELRDPLLIFLSSGSGEDLLGLREWMAFSGHRMIHLGYASSSNEVPDCEGIEEFCSEPARAEIVYGIDGSPDLEVPYEDSIVGRLDTLLLALDAEDPTMGWGSYRTGPGNFDWSRIVVAGWSEGATFTHLLAKDFDLHAGLVISGPLETIKETGYPDAWVIGPMATPMCRRWSFGHAFEKKLDDLMLAWELMGMTRFRHWKSSRAPPPTTARTRSRPARSTRWPTPIARATWPWPRTIPCTSTSWAPPTCISSARWVGRRRGTASTEGGRRSERRSTPTTASGCSTR